MTKDNRCKDCNCKIHPNCHVTRIEMGYQGLLLTGFKDSGFYQHETHPLTKQKESKT